MRFAGLLMNQIQAALDRPTADGTITGYNQRVYDRERYGDRYMGEPENQFGARYNGTTDPDWMKFETKKPPQPIRPGGKGIYY